MSLGNDAVAPRSRRNARRLEREMLDDFHRRAGPRTITPAPLLPQNRSLFPQTRSGSSPLHASCGDRASGVRINLHEQTRGVFVWRTTRGIYQSVLDLYFEVKEKPLTA